MFIAFIHLGVPSSVELLLGSVERVVGVLQLPPKQNICRTNAGLWVNRPISHWTGIFPRSSRRAQPRYPHSLTMRFILP